MLKSHAVANLTGSNKFYGEMSRGEEQWRRQKISPRSRSKSSSLQRRERWEILVGANVDLDLFFQFP
jgi:hypothetical protein